MVLMVAVPGGSVFAFDEDVWEFGSFDATEQSADEYVRGLGFALIAGSFNIAEQTPYGNMLELTANDRLIKWYRTDINNGIPITEDVIFEMDFMQTTKTAVAELGTPSPSPYQAPYYLYQLGTDGTNITFTHGGGKDILVAGYETGTVYNIKIAIELAKKSFRIWIDNTPVLTDKNLSFLGVSATGKIERFDFNMGPSGSCYIGRMSLSPYIDAGNELNKLKSAIHSANTALESMEAGDYLGQYAPEIVNRLAEAVAAAQASCDEWEANLPADAAPITLAAQTLNAAAAAAKAGANTAYAALYEMDFDSKGLADDGWEVYMGNGGVVSTGGSNVLKASGGSGQTRILKRFNTAISASRVTVEFSFMQEAKAAVTAIADLKAAPYNIPNTVAIISSDGNDIKIGNTRVIENYSADRWYRITLEINFASETIAVFVDGEIALAGQSVPFGGDSAHSIGRWETTLAASETNSVVYVDNISIKKNLNTEFEAEVDALEAGFGDLSCVVSPLTLPERDNGFDITWSSDHEKVIGLDGSVIRSEKRDERVTLTAVLAKDSYFYQGKFVMTVPRLHYGLLVNDDFEGAAVGSAPAGWVVTSGSALVSALDENQYVSLSDEMKQSVSYRDMTPSGFIAADFMQEEKTAADSMLALGEGDGELFRVRSDGSDILVSSGDTENILISNYEPGKWYSIRVLYDMAGQLFTVLTDNTVVLENITFAKNGSAAGDLVVRIGSANAFVMVDNIEAGRAKPASISLTGGSASVLRPASGETPMRLQAAVRDADGRMLVGEKVIWSIVNEAGKTPANVEAEEGVITIMPDSEVGRHMVRAALAMHPEIYAEKELEILAQKIKTVNVKGTNKINQEGDYVYTVEVISEHDVALPTDGAKWSVSGNGVSISRDGVLTVNSGIDKKVTIMVSIGGASGSMDVSIDTKGNSGGGGGGGGGFPVSPSLPGGTVTPNKPEENDGHTKKFVDVAEDFWAAKAIHTLSERDIVSGTDDTHFSPFAQVTRAQFAKLLAETFGLEAQESAVEFTDVLPENWCYPYISAAKQTGIVTGYADGRFGADDNIARQDAAVMLVRALEHDGAEMAEGATEFADAAAIAGYAQSAAAKLGGAGIMSGKDNNIFDPSGEMTRAEAAMVFWRVLNLTEGR